MQNLDNLLTEKRFPITIRVGDSAFVIKNKNDLIEKEALIRLAIHVNAPDVAVCDCNGTWHEIEPQAK